MNIHSEKMEILLHMLIFKLSLAEDEEEREYLIEVLDTALEVRQEYLDEMKRIDEEAKAGRMVFKPKKPLSDDEKAERRLELKQRNAKWN
jgi:hypothetical protein